MEFHESDILSIHTDDDMQRMFDSLFSRVDDRVDDSARLVDGELDLVRNNNTEPEPVSASETNWVAKKFLPRQLPNKILRHQMISLHDPTDPRLNSPTYGLNTVQRMLKVIPAYEKSESVIATANRRKRKRRGQESRWRRAQRRAFLQVDNHVDKIEN